MNQQPSPTNHNHNRKRRLSLLSLIALATLVIGVWPSAADHGLPHPEPLARGTFTDDVGATIQLKLDGRRTQVLKLRDASDIQIVKITLEPGAHAPWHDHSGPALLVNQGPGTFTSIHANDCVPRDYGPQEALVDPGQGNAHAGRNDSDQDVVIFAVFLGVENGPVLPITEPVEGCEFPL
jgi:hypothetical protein